MTGSETPIVRRLGIRPEHEVYVDIDTEETVPVDLGELGLSEVAYTRRLPSAVDVTLLFCSQRARLERRLTRVLSRTAADGMIWVCWPSRAAQVPTDLDEHTVRDLGRAVGAVDVRVEAALDIWSGLKLVRRENARPPP